METADIIKRYCEEAGIQREDDLVFPQQDCMTLAMNLANALKTNK